MLNNKINYLSDYLFTEHIIDRFEMNTCDHDRVGLKRNQNCYISFSNILNLIEIITCVFDIITNITDNVHTLYWYAPHPA